MELEKVDIKENRILRLDEQLLEILLQDKTTGSNLIWATDNYNRYGPKYYSDAKIKKELITGLNGNIIKPRVEKSKSEQQKRIKDKAEVFTPSWICNVQNNLIDEAWFGYKNVFNIEKEKTWIVNKNKIVFTNEIGKTWLDYIKENRLEISCGEAPYLVSRYDTVTGNPIDVQDRIGLLDRKLRVICENSEDEQQWLDYVKLAYKSIYGYDWQGDNVLLARENLLYTLMDFYLYKFNKMLDKKILTEFAEIITWNIFQMDGLKFVIPNSCKCIRKRQITFFDENNLDNKCVGCSENNINKHLGIYCNIKDWETNKAIRFVTLLNNK